MSRSLAFLFSVIWIIVITFGFYQVYLFINGYPLFTVAKKEEQKGYISFKSDPVAVFFMDSEYIGKDRLHLLYPLGVYRMCAEKLGYMPRCFSGSEVRTNDQEMLHYTGITLLPETLSPRLVTSEKVYLTPNKNGFFWYDTEKKQIFWIDKTSETLQSFYPEFIPDLIEWNAETKSYFLVKKKTKTQAEQRTELSFSSFGFTIPQGIELYNALSVDDSVLYENKSPKTIGADSEQVIRSFFTSAPEESFYFFGSSNFVLVFPHAALLYSLDGKDFRFLFSKDVETPVIYFSDARQFWFQKDGKMYVLQM